MSIKHESRKLAEFVSSASPGRMQGWPGEGAPCPRTHLSLALTLQATRCGQNFPKPRGGWIRLSRVTTSRCLILPLQRQRAASAVWWQTRGGSGLGRGWVGLSSWSAWWANPFTSLRSSWGKQLFPEARWQIKEAWEELAAPPGQDKEGNGSLVSPNLLMACANPGTCWQACTHL